MLSDLNKAADLTGYSKVEVEGRYLVRDFITDDFKKPVNVLLRKALRGQQTDNFEFPFVTKSGERVEILLNATKRTDREGKIVGMVGVGQDITELKRGQAELTRVANDLQLLIETANAPIFGINAEGRVNEWNRKMAAITGFSKDDVFGKDLVDEYISDEFRESVRQVLDDALHGQQTDNYQLPLFTKDGDRVEVLLNATTRVDAAGTIVGVVGVGQDITAINQSQAELTRVANDLRLLIDTANAPIFGIDTNGFVNEWNRKAAAITGFSREEVMGKDLVSRFITPEYQDSVGEVLHKALQGEETANFEFPLYTKDGKRVEVLLNATSRRDNDYNIVGVVGVGQDITDRKNAETRVSLLAADLQITELLGFFDRDGDGKIGADELGDCLRSLGLLLTQKEVADLRKEVIGDKVGWDQFKGLASKKPRQPEKTAQALNQAFQVFDKGTGTVDMAELQHIVTSMGEKITAQEFADICKAASLPSVGRVEYKQVVDKVTKP